METAKCKFSYQEDESDLECFHENLIFAVDNIPTSQLSGQTTTKPEIPLTDLERFDLKWQKKETEMLIAIDI